jgi:hypothetical protein
MSDQYNHELKLERAVQHLKSLEADIKQWLGEHPYFVVSKFDPERGEHSVWIRPEGDPPAELSLIIGDCLHNLRSALDSLAYDLARTYARKALPPTVAEKSEFPIFIDPDKFEEWRERKIGAIDPRAQADIERLQPYHEQESFRSLISVMARAHPEAYHPLWLLHKLSNIDKHRERHLTLFGPYAVMFGGDNAEFAEPIIRDAVSIEGDAKVFSYRPTDPSREVDAHFSFALDVAFQKGPPAFGEPVPRVLWRIYAFITRDVLPVLTPYLSRS